MTPTLWAILAAIAAIGGEYAYKTTTLPWHQQLYWWLPLSLFVSFCVYNLVRAPGTSLLSAFIVWTMCTVILRVFVTVFLLHDKVSPGTWCAVALVVAGRIIQHWWK